MKIAIESNAYYKNKAGSGVYCRNVVDGMKALSPDSCITLANRRSSEMDIKKKSILKRLLNAAFDIVWMQFVLPAQASKAKSDVLFCPTFLSPIFAPCGVVLTIFDMAFMRYPETCDLFFRTYLRVMLSLTKGRARKILTISEYSKKEIVKYLNVPEDRIEVIYPGKDERFTPGRSALGGKYGIPGKYFLYIGTIEPRKNIETIIDAFAKVKRESALPHSLVIAGGKGWYYDSVFRNARVSGVEDSIIFPGYIPEEDLPSLYRNAEAFVFPSLYEGFGLPVLEAMACGCPVIASNTSSIPEAAGDAAILIDPLDTYSIAASMKKVASDPGLREQLVNKGLERSRRFSWDNAAKKTLAALKNAAKEP